MITESKTNWRNVWLIQETMMTGFPDLIAEGSDTQAKAAKR
jgi:hypothetical protein